MFTKHYSILILSTVLIISLVFVYYVFLGEDGAYNTLKHNVVTASKPNATKTTLTRDCVNDKQQDDGRHVATSESPSTIQDVKPKHVTATNDPHLTVLNLWYDLDHDDEDIAVRLDPRIKQARKIGFNSRLIPILKKDDRVQLPLINNEHYLLRIKSINKKSNSDIEIYGVLDHSGEPYGSTLSFTTKKVLLALLGTPIGHFDVRMANDKGYIYQSDQVEDIEAVVDLPSVFP